MRKIILIILMFISLFSFGQRKEKWEQHSMFPKVEKGNYFALSVGLTTIDSNITGTLGVRFMSIANHWFSYGVVARGHFSRPVTVDNNYVNNMGVYGGFQLNPILSPKSAIHFSFPCTIGGGWLAQYLLIDNDALFTYNEIYYAYIEPGVELEFNVSKKMRMSVGAYYMLRYNISELSNYNPNLNNLSINLNFKWGNY